MKVIFSFIGLTCLVYCCKAVIRENEVDETVDLRGVFTTTTESPIEIAEQPDYLFVAPRNLRYDGEYRGRFMLLNSPGGSAVRVNISIWEDTSVESIDEEGESAGPNWVSLVEGEQVTVNPQESVDLLVDLPARVRPAREMRLYLTGVLLNTGNEFRRFTKLGWSSKNSSLFIQTDKGIYKPGESVKLRVFALDPQLKPLQQGIDIDVLDGEGNLIQRWTNAKWNAWNGIASQELQLSEEPVLGTWTIKASVGGNEESVSFNVDKYVLPKYDVEMIMPESVSLEDKEVKFTVKATYTYGKPVKGELRVTTSCNNVERVYGCFNGEQQVTFDNLYSGKEDWWSHTCTFTVTVSEGLTDKERNATASLTATRHSEEIAFDTPYGDFKPGLPYYVRIKLSHSDGNPVQPRYRGQDMQLTIEIESVKTYRNVSIDDFENDSYDINFMTDPYVKNFEINAKLKTFSRSHYAYAKDTTNNMFLQVIPSSEKEISVGEKSILQVAWTQPIEVLRVLVTTRGKIVRAEELDVSEVVKDEQLGYYVLNYSQEITPEMAPKSTIIFYLPSYGNDKTIVESATLKAKDFLVNKVEQKIKSTRKSDLDYSKPGDNVTLLVSAEQGSFLGIVAVDKSVKILRELNDITVADVAEDLLRYGESSRWVSSNSYDYDASNPWTPRKTFYEQNRGCYDLGESDLLIISSICQEERKQIQTITNTKYRVQYDAEPSIVLSSTVATSTIFLDKVAAESAQSVNRVANGESRGRAKPVVKVRKDFPETWLWMDTVSNSTFSTFTQPAPDSITTWLVKTVALHPTFGLGLASDFAQLRVFKPFFASMNLPYSIIRGEIFFLQVSVFNYQSQAQVVDLTLEGEGYEFAKSLEELKLNSSVAPNLNARVLSIPADDAATATFAIRATKVGQIDLQATAISRRDDGSPASTDSVLRRLKVEAEGTTLYFNRPVFVNLASESETEVDVNVPIPWQSENFVEDSERVSIQVTGDILGSTLNGLEDLVRMPYGCGEQNMVNFVPNVLVYNYLNFTNRLEVNIEEKLMLYISKGYQRELKYRHRNGAYSAFGDSDPEGSTWLTAFVVKSFLQAQGVINIDKTKLHDSITWLVGQQRRGEFSEKGKVLSKRLQGGTADDNIALSAYGLIALVHARNEYEGLVPKTILEPIERAGEVESIPPPPDLERAIAEGARFLEAQVPTLASEPYSLAITTYALALAKSSRAAEALNLLESLRKMENGKVYWTEADGEADDDEAEEKAERGWYYCTPPADVEMTAYALLTYSELANVENALPVARWLLAQRNSQGGFSSTQDTVVGLEALTKFASLVYRPNSALQIDVEAESADNSIAFAPQSFRVTGENDIILQTQDLASAAGISSVSIEARGQGIAIIDVNYRFNVHEPTEEEPFDLVVRDEDNGEAITLNICARYALPGESSMAVAEIVLPSGYEADFEELSKLKGSVDYLQRIETENKESKIVLYFDKIDGFENCFTVRGFRRFAVDDLREKTVTLYDYYNPVQRSTRSYQVRKGKSVCSDWQDASISC